MPAEQRERTSGSLIKGGRRNSASGRKAKHRMNSVAIGGRKAHIVRMTTPKFTNGQLVNFTPSFSQDSKSATGPYEILRQMPIEDGDETTYKIKSQANGQERIAREHQLENAL
jgi:hypothetical protein